MKIVEIPYRIYKIPLNNEKSPVPEMTEENTKKYNVTSHRLNEALVNIRVQKSQEYNKNHQEMLNALKRNIPPRSFSNAFLYSQGDLRSMSSILRGRFLVILE